MGAALIAIAGTDPGGEALPPDAQKLSAKEKHPLNLERLTRYLRAHNHPELAEWFTAEDDASVRVKRLVETGANRSPIISRMIPLILLWILGLFAVSNALIVLLFAALDQEA